MQGRPVNPNNYIYDPLIGFRFRKKVEGKFRCITVNDTVSVTATLTVSQAPGYLV